MTRFCFVCHPLTLLEGIPACLGETNLAGRQNVDLFADGDLEFVFRRLCGEGG
jgi:hypothetical protein